MTHILIYIMNSNLSYKSSGWGILAAVSLLGASFAGSVVGTYWCNYRKNQEKHISHKKVIDKEKLEIRSKNEHYLKKLVSNLRKEQKVAIDQEVTRLRNRYETFPLKKQLLTHKSYHENYVSNAPMLLESFGIESAEAHCGYIIALEVLLKESLGANESHLETIKEDNEHDDAHEDEHENAPEPEPEQHANELNCKQDEPEINNESEIDNEAEKKWGQLATQD